MPDCPRIGGCPFFADRLNNMPVLAEQMKKEVLQRRQFELRAPYCRKQIGERACARRSFPSTYGSRPETNPRALTDSARWRRRISALMPNVSNGVDDQRQPAQHQKKATDRRRAGKWQAADDRKPIERA